MHGRRWPIFAALLVAAAGCIEEPAPEPPQPAPAATTGAAFDPASTGSIEGRVNWQGEIPAVPKLLVLPDPENPDPDGKRLYWTPNPFRPLIDPDSHGMRDVVVYLRGIDVQRAAPWPHGRPRIEMVQRSLAVVQDGTSSRTGFVRRGDEVEAVNRDDEYHSLRLRGAAFFALPFVEKDRIVTKRLDNAGIVELTSGASYFWMCAYLLVVEHPYYTRTDATGRFRMTDVPPGRYELVCWMPSWVVRQKYRDPESALTSRIVFAPPLEKTGIVEVGAARTARLQFSWKLADVETSRR